MAQIKNTQFSQLDDVSKKSKLKTKEEPLEDTANEGCMQKMHRKFESCTDVLANYFECVRVFSNQKLEELRRKALQQQKYSENKSEVSLEYSEKFQELQKNPEFKNYSKKEKDLLIEDFDELPAQYYQTNKALRFTKRYAETYDRSYSERRKRFGYTFEEVEIEREKQYHKKQKNFWTEFKRLICCRGGNYIEELQQRQRETDAQSINQIRSEQKKEKNQNNIFLFEEDNPVQDPEELPQNHHQKSTTNGNKSNKQQNEYVNSSRKTESQESKKQIESEARKISSRLGMDTKLVIKRKQYECKTNDQYNQEINRQSVVNEVQNSPSGKVKTNSPNNMNTATNSERTGSNANNNQNQTNQNLNRFNIQDNYFNEDNQMNVSNNQNNNGVDESQGIDWNRNRRFQDGVAKVKVDKKAKISKMIKQVENQNDEQFNPNQVIFFSDDVNNNNNIDNIDNSKGNSGEFNDDNGNINQASSQINNSAYFNGDQQEDAINMSNISELNNSNYQRVKKTKTQNKNRDMIKKSFENEDQEDKIEYMEDNEAKGNNTWQQNNAMGNEFSATEILKKDSQNNSKSNSARLIVKDFQEQGKYFNLEDIPSVNNSTIQHGESAAFKKKRKAKKNLAQQPTQQEEKDDQIILVDQSNNYNTNANQNQMKNQHEYGMEENNENHQTMQMKVIPPPPQQMKKKKQKRNNLVVEGEVDQEVIDLDNF